MNYGKYFRLNHNLSRVENGIAIYDYIDMPAYFGPSGDNPMSPKYPISITIASNTVCFKLHYSSYKIENTDDDNEYPKYTYEIEDIYFNDKSYAKTSDKVKVAHMEEIIFELPFTNDSTNELSSILKEIYFTKFPMKEGKTSYGGRFLEQIIKKRYTNEDHNNNIIEADLYKKMKVVTDRTPSYSNLWLMDVSKNGEIHLLEENPDQPNLHDNNVVAFLRKLLLDFMFDLKHSDVFQNSGNYQLMFSGLMSDFYFSALMHKCEFYYYRMLIDEIEKNNNTFKKENRILNLYVDELSKAESLWIQDIINPLSDRYFEYVNPRSLIDKLKKEFRRNKFYSHTSWFAEPEEEMRRICFTMKDRDNNPHVCNTDTLIQYYHAHKKDGACIEEIINSRDKNRKSISQWFLRRYDFTDMVHFHLIKNANEVFVVLSLLLLSYIFLYPTAPEQLKKLLEKEEPFPHISIPNINFCTLILLTGCFIAICFVLKESHLFDKIKRKWYNPDSIYVARIIINSKRFLVWIGIALYTLFLAILRILDLHWYIWLVACIPLILIIKPLVSNLHLFYPRLVASITTAWLTLAAGNDLYGAFFDSIVSQTMTTCLVLIVFMFVLYEINRIIPSETTFNKLYRGFELTIISYLISLIIGALVINFTGERILERSGILESYYDNYITESNTKKVENIEFQMLHSLSDTVVKSFKDKERVEHLQQIRIHKTGSSGTEEDYPIAIEIGKGYSFFILRDFWIQFSFVAMFVGIFIQMIFEEKRITEI